MQKKNNSAGCNGPSQGSDCVIWTGKDIPALGIEKGDSVSAIVCTLAQQIETLAAPLDLTTVSIQCIIDKLSADEPVIRSIANMLQISYDSSCKLKDMIDAINAKLNNSGSSIVLDLKCLTTYDTYGNPLPYDEKSVLQTLINTACSNITSINAIGGTLTTLDNRVKALEDIPAYQEPSLNSCIFTGRKTSEAVVLTAQDLCTYKGIIGSQTDVQSAMAQFPGTLAQVYGLLPDWVITPTNLAQSYSNLLMVMADLYKQVQTINNTCCKVDCDSIIVDFDIRLSADRTSATLFFATKSSVPPGWTETNPLGSKLTVTDSAGSVFTIYIKILPQLVNPDGIIIDLSSSPLDTALDYTFNMNVVLSDGTLTCVKCVNHVATFKDTCQFCSIAVDLNTNNGFIVLIYTVPGNTNLQSQSIYSGQTQGIPVNARISDLIIYNGASYTTTCATLPSPSIASCYELSWGFSKSANGNDYVFTGSKLVYLSVLGVQYPVGVGYDATGATLMPLLNGLAPTRLGLISGLRLATDSSFAGHNDMRLYFLTVPSVAKTIEGAIGDPNAANYASAGFDGGAFFRAIPADSTKCPSQGSGGQGQGA